MSAQEDNVEKELVSRDKAEALAKEYKSGPTTKPLPRKIKDIPHSLLSAEHIVDVVKETGLISPFYTGGGRNSRLKKAAYEGRIGRKAYIYNGDSTPRQTFDSNTDDFLKVPKNQIVFVECDLVFRLPEFIALRFNLQIRHVHRGLLLGTGPLIDPGFCGRLCIPLHNLTDEDYYLPKDEGIIWLEFTKTTSSPTAAQNPIGRPPLGRKFWGNIEEFLIKASEQYGYDKTKPKIPIRSSLPTMLLDTKLDVEKSAAAAQEAAVAAKAAKKSADTTRLIGIVSALGAAIGIITLWATYYTDMNQQYDTVRPRIERLEDKVSGHFHAIEVSAITDTETNTIVSDTSTKLKNSLARIEELESQNAQQKQENKELRERMDGLERLVQGQKPAPSDSDSAPQQ